MGSSLISDSVDILLLSELDMLFSFSRSTTSVNDERARFLLNVVRKTDSGVTLFSE